MIYSLCPKSEGGSSPKFLIFEVKIHYATFINYKSSSPCPHRPILLALLGNISKLGRLDTVILCLKCILQRDLNSSTEKFLNIWYASPEQMCELYIIPTQFEGPTGACHVEKVHRSPRYPQTKELQRSFRDKLQIFE